MPLILLSLSCGKSVSLQGDTVISVSAELPCSRAGVGAESEGVFPFVWQEGDRVSLNGMPSNPLLASFSGTSEAAFSFSGLSVSAPYRLVYPGGTGERVEIDGSVPPMYSTGSSLDGIFAFRPLGCGVRLLLYGDIAVSSISLTATGGEAVAGEFEVSFADGTISAVSAMPSLSFDLAEPVALSHLFPEPFYVFFAPGTFSEGLVLRVESSDGESRKWRFATGTALEKGRLYLLPVSAFASKELPDGFEIALEGMTEETITFVL